MLLLHPRGELDPGLNGSRSLTTPRHVGPVELLFVKDTSFEHLEILGEIGLDLDKPP